MLDKEGINAKDVNVIQLQPDEAQPAFESGSVDAWAIWDPFISLHTVNKGAKVITDGEQLNVSFQSFNCENKICERASRISGEIP